MIKILCFDYGKKNIGWGIYNGIIIINPLLVIKNIFSKKNFIKKIILKENPKLILIGFPGFFRKNIKSYIEIIFLIKKFIINLINNFNIKIKIFNEYYSSKFFKNFPNKDCYSACFILKSYLIYKNFLNLNLKAVGFEPTM